MSLNDLAIFRVWLTAREVKERVVRKWWEYIGVIGIHNRNEIVKIEMK